MNFNTTKFLQNFFWNVKKISKILLAENVDLLELETAHNELIKEIKFVNIINNVELSSSRQTESQKNQPKCPRCGSTAITAGQRGYSIWTGFLRSDKTVNRCGNCGHKWKP